MLSAVSQSSPGDPLGPLAVTSFVGLSDLFYKLAQLVGMLWCFFNVSYAFVKEKDVLPVISLIQ